MPVCIRHDLVCSCNVEPEEKQAVAKEEEEKGSQQGDNTGAQESMQIEEISQQEGLPSQQGTDSSSQQGDTGGVMGAVMGAAKSLFGGAKHDEQVWLLPLATLPCLVLVDAAAQQLR